jgi:hypothetical protein
MFKGRSGLRCFAKLIVAVSVLFLAVSCSTTTQMYTGPERPASETALIKGADYSIYIERCDGTRVSSAALTVLPGEHTIEATYDEGPGGYYNVDTARLGWKAEAGHTYIVEKARITERPGTWGSMFIKDQTSDKKVSNALSKPGKEAARLRFIETKIKEFPNYVDFWVEKGYLLTQLQRYEEAMAALDTALSMKADSAYAWEVKSLVFYQQRLYDDSLTAIDKAIQLRGNESDKKMREEILKKMEEKKKRGDEGHS